MELAQTQPFQSTFLAERRADSAGAARAAPQRLARALGWFSIGLGLSELAMPRLLGRAIGIGPRPLLLRALGLREIASGIGILSRRQPASWIRSRVAGDALDLALLGVAVLGTRRTRRLRVVAAGAAVAGVTALDVLCSRQLERAAGAAPGAIRVRTSIAINRPVEELYQYWSNLDNMPRVISHLESVRTLDGRRSHWIAKGNDDGWSAEWDAEITAQPANHRISWRSADGAQVPTAGAVQFEALPVGRGTLVRIDLEYKPAGGEAGAAVAKLLGEAPEQRIAEDLRRFKQRMETGEVATTEGQPHGRRSLISRALP